MIEHKHNQSYPNIMCSKSLNDIQIKHC